MPLETSERDWQWKAVVQRDRSADTAFVYAVRSTGVYCKPSCPSRRPRRELVTFFERPSDAERAGYRACKRCRPSDRRVKDRWVEKIERACVYLANVDGHPSLATLARRFGGSPYHLQRNFKRLVGVTPREYADACRLRKVKRGLRESADVTRAVFDAGYGSSSRFYERAAPRLGMPPATYRRGGAGMDIRYTIVASPLGRLLVGATSRGICAIALAGRDSELRTQLAKEYPAATISEDDTGSLSEWTSKVVEHLQGRRPQLDLPLDVQATAFQWQVWQALASIPYGGTRTYGEIAAAIGRPRAVRAVARACATNPVALAVPCHRAVAANGRAGGYRWGVERKRALLSHEHKHNAETAETAETFDAAPRSGGRRRT